MDEKQRKYYWAMVEFNRGFIILKDRKVAAILTYYIAFEDDEKYLYSRVPWTIIADDSRGDTLYIDQFIVKTEKKLLRD